MAATDQIAAGTPPLEELVRQDSPKQLATEDNKTDQSSPDRISSSYKPPIETLPDNSRLWNEVLRNLSKDVNRHAAVTITGNSFSSIRNFRQRKLGGYDKDTAARRDNLIAFSCGHAFSEIQFQERILVEFFERVEDFMTLMPQMALFLQQYYKQSSSFTSGCPYCVFQYLRTAELKKDPNIPIRPWNY